MGDEVFNKIADGIRSYRSRRVVCLKGVGFIFFRVLPWIPWPLLIFDLSRLTPHASTSYVSRMENGDCPRFLAGPGALRT